MLRLLLDNCTFQFLTVRLKLGWGQLARNGLVLFQFLTVRLKRPGRPVPALYAAISIPHGPIEALPAVPDSLLRVRFQFLTVRLKRVIRPSSRGSASYFNSSRSD